ncbi:helix-turn-helix domain-containing protein [Flavitalea flava]
MDSKEEIFRKFGRQLALVRNQKNISVRELAATAFLYESHVHQIEAGEVDVLFTTILALAQALEIEPSELLQVL